jgi:hypothetical protein
MWTSCSAPSASTRRTRPRTCAPSHPEALAHFLGADADDDAPAVVVAQRGAAEVEARLAEDELSAVARDGRLEQVHGRRADEARDEEVDGASYSRCGVSTCCSTPSRITATRSPIVIASTWSCVT